MTWNLPSAETTNGPARAQRRRRTSRGLKTVAVGFVVTIMGIGVAAAAGAGGIFGQEKVGTSDSRGILLPTNQRITPLGKRLLITNGRLLSSALSPNGRYVAALSWEDFVGFVSIFDVKTDRLVQQIGTGATTADPPLGDTTVAADGPFWSPDGKTLWVSQTEDVLRFSVSATGTLAAEPVVIPLVDGTVGPYLPSGMALSGDGSRLYVALNGANTLGIIDTATNTLLRQVKVCIAPRQVVLIGSTAYVSNEGGRPAKPGDTTNLSDNTPVVSDPVTGAGVSGTVSVVDVYHYKQTRSIPVGLQPTALFCNGTAILVANSNNDSVSLIDTTTDTVAQTINVNPLPGSTVGSYPNAISMPDADHILVSIGRDNAIAAYRYNGLHQPVQYEGLIPTDWYPVNVQYSSAFKKIIVTNDRGIGARGPASTVTEGPDANPATGHNTYDDTGSLTSFAPPTEADLAGLTHSVFVDNDWEHLLTHPPVGPGPTRVTPGSSAPTRYPDGIVPPRTSAAERGRTERWCSTASASVASPGMGSVKSVNVGRARPNPYKTTRSTGIEKIPASGAVEVRDPGAKTVGLGSGLVGDFIGDGKHHGGSDQAIYAFAREDLDDWQQRLGRELPDGYFGENLTTLDVAVNDALIGEQWRVGRDVVLEVTSPRIPCSTFRGWVGEAGWLKRFTEVARPGAYLSILVPGSLRNGDEIEIIRRPEHGVTVSLAYRAFTTSPELMPEYVAAQQSRTPPG